MTSERLLNMNIEVLYIPKNFIPPKQISGHAPAGTFLNLGVQMSIIMEAKLINLQLIYVGHGYGESGVN